MFSFNLIDAVVFVKMLSFKKLNTTTEIRLLLNIATDNNDDVNTKQEIIVIILRD